MKRLSCTIILTALVCVMNIGCAPTSLRKSTATVHPFADASQMRMNARPLTGDIIPRNQELMAGRVETQPITADLQVSTTKVSGTAVGGKMEEARLVREAIARALGQDPPNPEGADVLVAADVYVENIGREMKVTVSGYPAFYVNFQTTTEDTLTMSEIDSLRRQQYSSVFNVTRILKELADRDSGYIMVKRNDVWRGNRKIPGPTSIVLRYPAKNVPNEEACCGEGDAKTSGPHYHEFDLTDVFDLNMLTDEDMQFYLAGKGVPVSKPGPGIGSSVFKDKDADKKNDNNKNAKGGKDTMKVLKWTGIGTAIYLVIVIIVAIAAD